MPSSLSVVQETCRRLGYLPGALDVNQVRTGFDGLLRKLFEETLVVLEECERQVDAGEILPEFVRLQQADIERERLNMRNEGDDTAAFQSAIVRLLQSWHRTLRGVFLSISQSRKQRGGKDFEYQIQVLLELALIPHEVQSRRERADFILPSAELLQRDRPKAVLLSAKRTLRERWQEVVDELQRVGCPNTYLATADDSFTKNVVAEIRQRNIYLVVWDEVANGKFADEHAVIGYSKFIRDLTDHFLPQWP